MLEVIRNEDEENGDGWTEWCSSTSIYIYIQINQRRVDWLALFQPCKENLIKFWRKKNTNPFFLSCGYICVTSLSLSLYTFYFCLSFYLILHFFFYCFLFYVDFDSIDLLFFPFFVAFCWWVCWYVMWFDLNSNLNWLWIWIWIWIQIWWTWSLQKKKKLISTHSLLK
jgi:hypothetical protein